VLKPTEVEARLLQGAAYQSKRDWIRRSFSFREAIRLRPNAAEAHYYLGYALGVKGLLKDSISELETALGSNLISGKHNTISERLAGFLMMSRRYCLR